MLSAATLLDDCCHILLSGPGHRDSIQQWLCVPVSKPESTVAEGRVPDSDRVLDQVHWEDLSAVRNHAFLRQNISTKEVLSLREETRLLSESTPLRTSRPQFGHHRRSTMPRRRSAVSWAGRCATPSTIH